MTYLYKKKIDESINQNLRKKDVYKSNMHKIYNLIVDEMNGKWQQKAASEATFQAVKTNHDPIGYLIILKWIYFSIQSEQHPIQSLCLAVRYLYNTMKYSNKNTTDYLVRFRNTHKVNEVCNWSLIPRDI